MAPTIPESLWDVEFAELVFGDNVNDVKEVEPDGVQLYREILRVHRYLPLEMRSLGDDYVKAEFRRHRKTNNPLHIIGFLSQWKMYLDELPKSKDAGARWAGRKLDPTVFEKMSSEQIGQLYELMHATKEVWKTPAELEANAETGEKAPETQAFSLSDFVDSLRQSMANIQGPGDPEDRNHGQFGTSSAAPYDGYGQYQASFDRTHQNYPPLHNQSNPSFYKSQNNLTMTKDEDVVVSERYVSRTPSPTPSEASALNRKGLVDWQKMAKWKFWFRREWIWYYVILTIIMIFVILISVYDRQIVRWLEPDAQKVKKVLPAGWLIPIAVLFIISFPPLAGQEIVAILCGVVWGLWVGFAIVSAGTFLGELGNFYAFKYCCRARGEKLEKTKLNYGCLARVVRDGGLKIAIIARYSAIPGHFTTAIFSTCGMHVMTFAIAAFLSLPKQFVTVYIGVIIQESGTGTESTKDKIISDAVLGITVIITGLAMWYIYKKMDLVKVDVIYERRKARQAKLFRANSASGSSTAFNPRDSDSDLPLNPGESAAYQQWDSEGRAVGYSGNPSISYNVHAPAPQRTGGMGVNSMPEYRTDGGDGYSSPTARYGSPGAVLSSTSASRTASPGRAQQRQDSLDTVSWNMSGQGMSSDAYRLPTINPATPLSGGFVDKPISTSNAYTQQQSLRQSSLNNPFLSSENLPSRSSPVPPPLAPPPSSTRTYDIPTTPQQYQPQAYSTGPPSTGPFPPQSAPLQQQYPTNPNPAPLSAPLSPIQTPTQHNFAYQQQGASSGMMSPAQAYAQSTTAYQPPSGPPPSLVVGPGAGAHAQIANDASAYYTPPHPRVATEDQLERSPLPSGAFSSPPDYRP
ncbi:hypothetical protein EW145_g4446 [Phellinidium pouzarii]|uniref:Golgi apparatus membrane protein TVP38 n=1 Tax=Phellinidium pouzarii TaxID=167371 RepID=A0A4S4L3Y7_9AGAM|nr:hypothetical protein EW145_g4446 [Phellinidium pouzarii]